MFVDVGDFKVTDEEGLTVTVLLRGKLLLQNYARQGNKTIFGIIK